MRAGRNEAVIRTREDPALRTGVLRLAREGAALIRHAMAGPPELREAALRYATLLAETVEPSCAARRDG